MTDKLYYHNIDLGNVSQIKGTRKQNLTTAARVSLGSSLNTAHEGLFVWDTDLKAEFNWNGSAWVQAGGSVAGAMVYMGTHASLSTAPSTPSIGYVYALTTGGTITWAGQTINPSAVVQVNDQAVYRGSDVWDILQGNSVEATTSTLGLTQLATQGVVNTGTNTTAVVTAETLTGFVQNKGFAKTYFNSSVSVSAGTPFNIVHNLGLQNKDSFTISVKDSSGSEVSLDVDSVDVNTLTIEAGIALTGLKVVVIGF